MAGKIIADTIETGAGADISTSYVVNGSAKAWAKYRGSSTVIFYDSFGCTSISDNGTGLYGMTLTNAFSSSNYAVTGEDSGGEMFIENASAHTTTTFNTTHTTASGGAFQDVSNIAVILMGDLA